MLASSIRTWLSRVLALLTSRNQIIAFLAPVVIDHVDKVRAVAVGPLVVEAKPRIYTFQASPIHVCLRYMVLAFQTLTLAARITELKLIIAFGTNFLVFRRLSLISI